MINMVWDRGKKQVVVTCTDDVEFLYMQKMTSDSIDMISIEE